MATPHPRARATKRQQKKRLESRPHRCGSHWKHGQPGTVLKCLPVVALALALTSHRSCAPRAERLSTLALRQTKRGPPAVGNLLRCLLIAGKRSTEYGEVHAEYGRCSGLFRWQSHRGTEERLKERRGLRRIKERKRLERLSLILFTVYRACTSLFGCACSCSVIRYREPLRTLYCERRTSRRHARSQRCT